MAAPQPHSAAAGAGARDDLGGVAADIDEPATRPAVAADVLAPIRRLGARASRVGIMAAAIAAALAHSGVVIGGPSIATQLEFLRSSEELKAAASSMREAMHDFQRSFEIDVEPDKPKEEEPAAVAPEPEPEPEAPPAPPPAPDPAPTAPPPPIDPYDEPPAAAAADAPKILTANDDSGYADMEDVMVSGSGEGPGYGYVTPGGTGTAATFDPNARKDGVTGGTGTAAAPPPPPPAPKVNRSRPADLVGSRSWSCPFPPEADAEQINRATAVIVVTVSASGRASSARVVNDPGFGFGRAAQQCAMSRRYSPALDIDGQPIRSTTPPINVTFRR